MRMPLPFSSEETNTPVTKCIIGASLESPLRKYAGFVSPRSRDVASNYSQSGSVKSHC